MRGARIQARVWDDGQVFLVLPSPPLAVMVGRLVAYFGQGQTRTLAREEVMRVSSPAPRGAGDQLERELREGVGRPGSMLAELTRIPPTPAATVAA